MRLEYIPSNMVGDVQLAPLTPASMINSIRIYEDINTYDITAWSENKQLMSNTIINVDPKKSWVMIRDNKPLAKS